MTSWPPARSRAATRWPRPRAPRALAASLTAALAVTTFASGCSGLRDRVEQAASPPPTTGPPPGASQPPGPPLATATLTAPPGQPAGPPDLTDPEAVAADCFARWQSFDARTDDGPGAGVRRASDCFTPDFLAQLTGGASDGGDDQSGRAWEELRAAGVRSTVMVLAVTPLGDTEATGRVVLMLNVRRETVTDAAPEPVQTVSAPTVTLLRDRDGRWRLAGADLAGDAADAPGR